MQKKIILVVLAIALVAAACGASKTRIETRAEGDFVIEDVQLADRFPPDCSPQSTGCYKAEATHRFLVVWLEAQDPEEADDLSTAAPHLSTDEGAEVEAAIKGIHHQRYFLAFTPRVSAEEFTLHWADNPPIDLGEYLEE